MGNYLDANGLGKYTQLIKNGYMPGATVGSAEQITTDVGAIDKVPYNFRTSGGSIDIGDRERDKIVGGTVAWNQRATLSYGGPNTGTSKTYDSSTGITTCADNSGTVHNSMGVFARPFDSTHKNLVIVDVKPTADGEFAIWGACNLSANVWTTIAVMGTGTEVFAIYANALNSNWSLTDSFEYKNVMAFDLTQMFGSTVADYIYSLEQANVGDGVAWFRKLFPKPYYAYNAGELMSVKTSAHNMVGFNAWDEEWESGDINGGTGENESNSSMWRTKNYIPVLPNTQYYMYGEGIANTINNRARYYDADKNYLGYIAKSGTGNFGTIFTTPDNCYYMRFSPYVAQVPTGTKVCINLSWDGSRDGEYEPYELHSYPLDADLELRGIPKLDANNALYYDGDIYEADGTVTRKYGIVDLGSLGWSYRTTTGSNIEFLVELLTAKPAADASSLPAAICPKYKLISANDAYNAVSVGLNIANSGGTPHIFVYDSAYSDPATFKTAMDGVYLVYELATPTEETADPYAVTQIVNDFGTEEYVDTRDVAVPVGHETFYQINLKSKLEMAPNSPSDGNGDYIVRQTDGINAYVPLVIPNELPDAPSEDGAYQLTVTVTDGEPVYSWEAVE